MSSQAIFKESPQGHQGRASKLALLELVRFAAAFWVVVHHVAQRGDAKGFVWSAFKHTGQLPVMLFFVLSGFVIGLRYAGEPLSPRQYLKARALRIYPIFLAVLILGTGLCSSGLLPGFRFTWSELVGNIFMLQGPNWFRLSWHVDPWAGNSPLWSLSIEWWFYVAYLFISQRVSEDKARNWVHGLSLVGLALLTIWACSIPLWMLLLSIWWTGVELGREYKSTGHATLSGQKGSLLYAWGCVVLIVLFFFLHGKHSSNSMMWKTIMQWQFYGAVFFTVAIASATRFASSTGRLQPIYLALGGCSYALYAVHYLVLLLFMSWAKMPVSVMLAVVGGISIMIAMLLEYGFQPVVKRLFAARATRLEI